MKPESIMIDDVKYVRSDAPQEAAIGRWNMRANVELTGSALLRSPS